MSYFGSVHMDIPRAPAIEAVATYLGVAPEFTAVLYKPGDPLGISCALASLVPIAILVAHLTLFLSRRQWQDLWFAGGQVVCEILNGVIKLIIKQPRPMAPVTNMPADSYGMPSAHAQFMGFVSTMLAINLITRASDVSLGEKLLRAGISYFVAIFVAYSRYYLYYHSGQQVCVGMFVGMGLAIVWSLLGKVFKQLGVVDWALELWPCRLMLVKDNDYSVREEYRVWKQQKEVAQKKKDR